MGEKNDLLPSHCSQCGASLNECDVVSIELLAKTITYTVLGVKAILKAYNFKDAEKLNYMCIMTVTAILDQLKSRNHDYAEAFDLVETSSWDEIDGLTRSLLTSTFIAKCLNKSAAPDFGVQVPSMHDEKPTNEFLERCFKVLRSNMFRQDIQAEQDAFSGKQTVPNTQEKPK
jgi:hypothetical protein